MIPGYHWTYPLQSEIMLNIYSACTVTFQFFYFAVGKAWDGFEMGMPYVGILGDLDRESCSSAVAGYLGNRVHQELSQPIF